MNIFNILSESIVNQKPNINNSIEAGRKIAGDRGVHDVV